MSDSEVVVGGCRDGTQLGLEPNSTVPPLTNHDGLDTNQNDLGLGLVHIGREFVPESSNNETPPPMEGDVVPSDSDSNEDGQDDAIGDVVALPPFTFQTDELGTHLVHTQFPYEPVTLGRDLDPEDTETDTTSSVAEEEGLFPSLSDNRITLPSSTSPPADVNPRRTNSAPITLVRSPDSTDSSSSLTSSSSCCDSSSDEQEFLTVKTNSRLRKKEGETQTDIYPSVSCQTNPMRSTRGPIPIDLYGFHSNFWSPEMLQLHRHVRADFEESEEESELFTSGCCVVDFCRGSLCPTVRRLVSSWFRRIFRLRPTYLPRPDKNAFMMVTLMRRRPNHYFRQRSRKFPRSLQS